MKIIAYFMEQNKNIGVTHMQQNSLEIQKFWLIVLLFTLISPAPPPNIQEITNMKHKGVNGDKSRGF